MSITLKNDELTVVINPLGAELISLIHQETEYIWQGDPTIWGRHAPHLFPIVGKLKDDQYRYEDKVYEMTQHGFARDKQFEVIQKTEQSVCFSLTWDEETLKQYPFYFRFEVNYQLKGKELVVNYQITNLATDQEMLFSVGAHPGFKIPLRENKMEDFSIVIVSDGELVQIPIDPQEVLIKYNQKEVVAERSFQLTENLFQNGVLVFESTEKTAVKLLYQNQKTVLNMVYTKMPYLGIWSTFPKTAPFVCIEPWAGLADEVDSSGKLEQKKGVNKLAPLAQFDCQYTIQLA